MIRVRVPIVNHFFFLCLGYFEISDLSYHLQAFFVFIQLRTRAPLNLVAFMLQLTQDLFGCFKRVTSDFVEVFEFPGHRTIGKLNHSVLQLPLLFYLLSEQPGSVGGEWRRGLVSRRLRLLVVKVFDVLKRFAIVGL